MALFLAGVWTFLALAAVYSLYLSRGTPQWYVREPLSDRQQQAAANQADQQAAELLSYASDVAAAQRREFLTGKAPPGGGPAPMTLTLGERQLNAFLAKWRTLLGPGTAAQSSAHFSSPRVALLGGRLVIAGTLRDLGLLSNTVASVEFDLPLDAQGNLRPRIAGVYGGRLPVPQVLLDVPRRRIIDALESQLDQWQARATLGPDELANGYMAEAAAGKLLLAALQGRAAAPIVLLPCDLGGFRQAVPLWIDALHVSDGSMTVTLRPCRDGELWNLLRSND